MDLEGLGGFKMAALLITLLADVNMGNLAFKKAMAVVALNHDIHL